MFMFRFSVVLILVLGASPWAAVADDVWAASYDAGTKTRYIPVELWTGAVWDGGRDLAMTPADLVFGDCRDKTIRGPREWTHPVTGGTFQVYERENKGKVQLFTVRSQRDGLGRVFDSRGERVCTDGIKFPLGLWREGETRTFFFDCWKNGKAYQRRVVITIERIDFTHDGVGHALRYRWVADNGDRKGLNNAYTYAPGQGNTALEYRH